MTNETRNENCKNTDVTKVEDVQLCDNLTDIDLTLDIDLTVGIGDLAARHAAKQEQLMHNLATKLRASLSATKKELTDLCGRVTDKCKIIADEALIEEAKCIFNAFKPFIKPSVCIDTEVRYVGHRLVSNELKVIVSLTVRAAKSNAGYDSTITLADILIHVPADVTALAVLASKCEDNIEKLQNELIEVNQSLRDIGRFERQARGAIVQTSLENTEAGRKYLDKYDENLQLLLNPSQVKADNG